MKIEFNLNGGIFLRQPYGIFKGTFFVRIKEVFFFVLCFLCLAFFSSAQTYTWKNIAMGGAGMITAVVPSKTQQNLVYARTDVGGAYRWDNASSVWVPLLDWNSDDEKSYQGVEALALDPQNSSSVYMLVGTSYWNGGKTAILRSTDYGASFSLTDVSAQFTAHGNGNGRGGGERLAVDPNNSNILLCGTRSNGLWKSTNAGATWTQLWNGVTTTPNGNGICFVVFDGSSVAGGVTQRIFIGVSRTGGGTPNLYMSTDGGATFNPVAGSPTNLVPIRAALASNGNLFITYSVTQGPYDAGTGPGKIYKYNIAGNTMTDVSPSASFGYSGISVDPANANRLIACSYGFYWNQYVSGASTGYGDRFFLSTNGGTSWTDLVTKGAGMSVDNNGMPWINGNSAHAIHLSSCIEFDPFNTARAWVTSGNGLFRCDNVNAAQTTWVFDVKGIEETVPLDFISIPGGPEVSAIGDYDGFVQPDVAVYVNNFNPQQGSNNGIAYAAASTSKLVRTANGGNRVYYSTNQGATWTGCTSNQGGGGKVAICADGTTIIHCPNASNTTYYSTNNGNSWTSTGVTNVNNAFPVADPANTNYVYIYDQANGNMRVSSNKGQTFTTSGAPGSWGSKRLAVVPGNAGHIWIAMYGNGLKYSTNFGANFTTIAGVTYCAAVGIGKAAPGATYPTIYIWGTVGGVRGLYRSINQGSTWVRINDDAHEWGGVYQSNGEFVIGDMDIYGRVYVSTVGRGIIYGDDLNALPVKLLNFEGKLAGGKINVTWRVIDETDMVGYKLMRTVDPSVDSSWKEIAYISSGNSGESVNVYNVQDSDFPLSSTIYYKLIQLDNDGTISESKVIVISISSLSDAEGSAGFAVYPNPSDFTFTVVVLNENLKTILVEVIDLTGKLWEEQKGDSAQKSFLVGENLAPGIYILRLSGSNGHQTIKLVKK